jgi:hypothetical protein
MLYDEIISVCSENKKFVELQTIKEGESYALQALKR